MVGDLLLWAKGQGTTLHESVQIYEDPITGLSFRAIEDISPETNLVRCSYGVSLSYLNAVDAPHFPRHSGETFPQTLLDALKPEHPNIIGHLFLIQQYLLKEKSFWWPYIRLLPQPDAPSIIPALWPEEDQRYLDGTNAEPAIKKRLSLWGDEWLKVVSLLSGFQEAKQYTFTLYKWAASVYGSRSFRPSLTILESFLPDHAAHVAKDKFSILFPVMDVGNHNGINNVNWNTIAEFHLFVLSSRGIIRRNEQIFNFYGNKSNSELLVAYGFTLLPTSHLDRDVVDLKLKPRVDALTVRRSQSCHIIAHEPREEVSDPRVFFRRIIPIEYCNTISKSFRCVWHLLMIVLAQSRFTVKKRIDRGDHRPQDLLPFSDGLVDLLVCMVANERERNYLLQHKDYCPESDSGIFGSPLSRAAFRALQILVAKLVSEQERIADCMALQGWVAPYFHIRAYRS